MAENLSKSKFLCSSFSNLLSTAASSAPSSESSIESVIGERFRKQCHLYFDLLDQMKVSGLSQSLTKTLPNIVVVGNQSAGKSSLLESISGIRLPTGTGITTRCPLQMVLREDKNCHKWQAVLRNSHGLDETVFSKEDVAKEIADAQKIMVRNEDVTSDILTLEIHGEDLPNVTLIDLPGLISSEKKSTREGTKDQLQQITREYIRQENNIVVAVLDSLSDVEISMAVSELQEIKANPDRVMAVFTKFDCAPESSKRKLLEDLKNEEFIIKDCTIVCCRFEGENNQTMSITERHRWEKQYFNKDPVIQDFKNNFTDKKIDFGIETFTDKVVRKLMNSMKSNFNQWERAIEKELLLVMDELSDLGPERLELEWDHKKYIHKIITEWTTNISYALKKGSPNFQDSADLDKVEESLHNAWTRIFTNFSSSIRSKTAEMFEANGKFSTEKLEMWLQRNTQDTSTAYQASHLLERFTQKVSKYYLTESNKCLLRIDQQLRGFINDSIDKEFRREHETLRAAIKSVALEQTNVSKRKASVRVNDLLSECEVMCFLHLSTFNENSSDDENSADVVSICLETSRQLKNSSSQDGMKLVQNLYLQMKKVFDKKRLILTSSIDSQRIEEGSDTLRSRALELHENLKKCYETIDSHLEVGIPSCIRMNMHINFVKEIKKRLADRLSQDDFYSKIIVQTDDTEKRKPLEQRSQRLSDCMDKIREIRRA